MNQQPLTVPVFGKDFTTYQVAREWTCFVNATSIRVPAGFICDGASVPRWLWSFTPPDGLHRAAAVAHDWLYSRKGCLPFQTFTRSESDAVFLSLLREFNVPHALTMWAAVRACGWLPWKRSTGIPKIEPVRYEFT